MENPNIYQVFAIAIVSGIAAAIVSGLFSYLTLVKQHDHERTMTKFERNRAAYVKLVRASHLIRQYLAEVLVRSENETLGERAERLSTPLNKSFELSMEAIVELGADRSAVSIVETFWEVRISLINYQSNRAELESGNYRGAERSEIVKDLRENEKRLREQLTHLEEVVKDRVSDFK